MLAGLNNRFRLPARYLVLLTCLLLVFSVDGQQPSGTSFKKAKKAFYKAENYFKAGDFPKAISYAQRAVELDDHFTEGYLMLGDLYSELDESLQSAFFYKKASELDPGCYPDARLMAAKAELKEGLYSEAKIDLEIFLDQEGITAEKRLLAENLLERSNFAIQGILHPVPFTPVNLGSGVNSSSDEYINAITLDNSELYLTVGSRTGDGEKKGIKEEDFYLSHGGEEGWGKREPLGPPMNTPDNEGALFISPDGRYLLFSACNQPDGYGSCDLYISFRKDNRWGEPRNLGPVINSAYWETQPCLGSDGRTLFFVSNRPGGLGGSDVWYSIYLPDSQWSKPVNLGETVNTTEDEMAPFIHPDNRTLYFSSRGHVGMGGYDLFLCRKDSPGQWTEPKNLGFPINTLADEVNLIVDASGTTAYVSSAKAGGLGGMDIYKFDLYPEVRPLQVTYMKGKVLDAETLEPVGSGFNLMDLKTGLTVIESFSDELTGSFLLSLPTDKDYALNVTAKGYAFHSEHIALRGVKTFGDPLLIDIALKPIKPDQVIVMKNIFFQTGQYLLEKESLAELNTLMLFLNENPGVQIEIRGHTDLVGTEEYNARLSLMRAFSVYQYLVENGIHASRLQYNGYGYSIPVASNETEEGRRLNRRTEFRILTNQ